MKDLEHIKLYKGENQDILRQPPSLLVKAGTYLICLTLAGIFILSQYLKIPDVVDTELTLKKNQISFVTASSDTVVRTRITADFVQKGEEIARYGNDNTPKPETTLQRRPQETLVSPLDGYLLETTGSILSFVNKGDTLFKIIPVEGQRIQTSFRMAAKYKTLLESETDPIMTIEEESKCFSFQILSIKNWQKDTIEVCISTDAGLLKYFYPAPGEEYVLPIQLPMNQQSVFNRLVSAIFRRNLS